MKFKVLVKKIERDLMAIVKCCSTGETFLLPTKYLPFGIKEGDTINLELTIERKASKENTAKVVPFPYSNIR